MKLKGVDCKVSMGWQSHTSGVFFKRQIRLKLWGLMPRLLGAKISLKSNPDPDSYRDIKVSPLILLSTQYYLMIPILCSFYSSIRFSMSIFWCKTLTISILFLLDFLQKIMCDFTIAARYPFLMQSTDFPLSKFSTTFQYI